MLATPMARVLITREHAQPLADLLVASGHGVTHVPLVELVATGLPRPSAAPDAVLMTSQAVARFAPDLADCIRQARTAVVGQATASALRCIGVHTHYVGTAGGLDALAGLEVTPQECVWFIGALHPSPKLAERLDRLGVHRWSVYENRVPVDAKRRLKMAEYDVVTFTSSSAVAAFVNEGGDVHTPAVVLGATTETTARRAGFQRVQCAESHTLAALAAAASAID